MNSTYLPDNTDSVDLDISATNSTNLITIKPSSEGVVIITTSVSAFNDRILEVGWKARVTIQDIRFTGAHLVLNPSTTTGGGAILNFGHLTLKGTRFYNNTVSCATTNVCQSYVNGGAILNYENLTIIDSSIVGNSADRGWAIFNTGSSGTCDISTLPLFRTTVSPGPS